MNIKHGETGNVTSLLHYHRPMKNPILVELLDYWESLRAGRTAPLRSEIDPRKIENALEHAFILERNGNHNARFRIAGMQLCTLMGMEIRGMPATALIAPDSRAQFTRLIERLFSTPEILELQLEAPCPGRETLTGQMLLLPMKNDAGEVSRVLGCLVTTGHIASPPNRFAIQSMKTTRIIATRGEDRSASSHQPTDGQTVAGFAEPRSTFVPRPKRPKGAKGATVNYLRLVKTDD